MSLQSCAVGGRRSSCGRGGTDVMCICHLCHLRRLGRDARFLVGRQVQGLLEARVSAMGGPAQLGLW